MSSPTNAPAVDYQYVTDWLVEDRLNATAPCPLGFVCDRNRMANCTNIRAISIAYGFGDVHGGDWCLEGSNLLQVCPVGYYCPAPDVRRECPENYFCPHKTVTPEVDCQGCVAGAEELIREWYGFLLVFSMFFLLGLYIMVVAFKRYQTELYGHFVELSSRSVDSARLFVRRKQRMQELERLRPKLFAIQQRLMQLNHQQQFASTASLLRQPSSSSPAPSDTSRSLITPHVVSGMALSIDQDSGKITYQAGRLFDALDRDGNGLLDFGELQRVLELNPQQLQAFVQRMNALAKVSTSSKEVSRPVFTRYFLQVLEETTNFGPTVEEIEELFHDLAKGSDVAAYQDFFDSRLTMFLSDPQINHLIALLRKAAAQDEEHDADHKQQSSGAAIFNIKRQQSTTREVDSGPIPPPYPGGNRRQANEDLEGARPFRQPSTGPPGSLFLGKSISLFGVSTLFIGGAGNGWDPKRYVHHDTFNKYYGKLLTRVTTNKAGEMDFDAPGEYDRRESATIGGDMTTTMGIDLNFENLSLAVPVGDKKVKVVNNVSGRLQARTMTALMGGSGAGKTSLLNALCGRAFYGETTGTIRINGHTASIEEHKDATGFVPQDDIVHAELTVKENLIYSGRFTLPKGTSMEEIDELADAVLANLGLSRVADSIVGDVNRRGVSGGEKKCVNIGIEVMSRPSILFLDEPTSGLDASLALLVMESLKNLTETQGVTVLSVIHQPRKAIFEAFDSLVLLGVGGHVVYHGPVPYAQAYFANLPTPYLLPPGESLADWLIDVSSGS